MDNWIPDLSQSEQPVYMAIADSIERAVKQKLLRVGDQLPTHRKLADRLEIAVQTVSRAYAEAERRNLVTAEVGRGTFVQGGQAVSMSRYVYDEVSDNSTDLSNNMPLVSRTHVERIKNTFPTLANSPSLEHILANRPVPGIMIHRETGVQWLANSGVDVSPDEILVTNGAAHALWACMATLGDPAHPVATECLVDNAVITNASILRLPLKGIELDEEGMVPEALDRVCKANDVRILVISPDYNNPTASLMSQKRREAIVELARKHDLSIIEFDCYGALIENRLPTLFSLAPERTYYTTSFSLTVMSALRTGFIATPPRQAGRIRSRLRATGWMANTIAAEIATRWMNDGTLDELVGLQRSQLKERNLILEESLSGCKLQSHATAPFAWMGLPEHWSPKAFVDYAYRHAIRVTPPLPFSVTGDDKSRAVRISLGGSTQDDIVLQQALSELANLANDHPDPLDYRF